MLGERRSRVAFSADFAERVQEENMASEPEHLPAEQVEAVASLEEIKMKCGQSHETVSTGDSMVRVTDRRTVEEQPHGHMKGRAAEVQFRGRHNNVSVFESLLIKSQAENEKILRNLRR